jgi:acyl-CoA reductase-like NAD-dependent aldehyde dehydrogenase
MTSMQHINNFINGQFVPTEAYLESFNPSTEEVIAYIADSSAEDANRAVQAARQAFPSYVKRNNFEDSSCFFNFVQMESTNNR